MATSLNASNTFSSTNKIASNEGRFRDHAPHLPAAGKILSSPGDTAAACMKLFEHRAETPPHVRPFRKSFNHEPGRAARHPGKAHDGPPPDIRYGCRSDHSVSASSLVHPHQETAWTERQREAKEGIYHSNRKEPIGTSKSHGTVMPSECHESGFRFGSRSNASESAKAVIYPIDQEKAEIEALARTAERQQTSAKAASVRRTDAGEQKDRSYNWGAHQVDPSSFRFGHIERTGNEGGVAAALRPDDDEKTMVVKKVVEDFKDRRTDELGKPKKMWGITAHLPPDHVFGKTNMKEDWGARECVRGGNEVSTKEEQTLGRSVRRVPDAEVDTSRVFGVPTIRTDLPKPARKRVTEYQNYGDEADAGGLLYPSRFADADVHEEDFLAAVDKETMQKLSERAGFSLSETDFESVWNLAGSYTQDGSVSVETFRRSLDELGL